MVSRNTFPELFKYGQPDKKHVQYSEYDFYTITSVRSGLQSSPNLLREPCDELFNRYGDNKLQCLDHAVKEILEKSAKNWELVFLKFKILTG